MAFYGKIKTGCRFMSTADSMEGDWSMLREKESRLTMEYLDEIELERMFWRVIIII